MSFVLGQWPNGDHVDDDYDPIDDVLETRYAVVVAPIRTDSVARDEVAGMGGVVATFQPVETKRAGEAEA